MTARRHAISGRGINLFKTLRRHFQSDRLGLPTSCPAAPGGDEDRGGDRANCASSGCGINLFNALRRHFQSTRFALPRSCPAAPCGGEDRGGDRVKPAISEAIIPLP